MSILLHLKKCGLIFLLLFILCITHPSGPSFSETNEYEPLNTNDSEFSILILGDSQMTGSGWEGGYENCILETYPNARVLNLAQPGALLSNGDIQKQWDFYVSEGFPATNFVLLDGGCNDLPRVHYEEDNNVHSVTDELRSLIKQIHSAMPDARIIYTLMPPLAEWKDSENGPPAYYIQEQFWKQLNIHANQYDYVTVLDLFSINPFRFPCSESYKKYFSDSIHLNEAGYRKTYEYIDNIIVAHLSWISDE